ncbi:MAG: von Willebrand factor type A domain-containing protein [Bacteroidetes bacterium]|nr:von Willebrand factor type A domain-containing protein [Bacteroidota bacterium]MBS1649718.1 von Willebrand factor type A domain-containing protein [Bacteroidota bacterium]
MKHSLLLILLCLSFSAVQSQYYLRGQVKDERGKPLEGAKIYLATQGTYVFYSEMNGLFGIPSSSPFDSVFISFDGYETFRAKVDTRLYQTFFLKMLPSTAKKTRNKILSLTKNLNTDNTSFFSALGESYSSLVENKFINTSNYPETGFSLNVDRASYANIRRFINNKLKVPTDAVRIEEMLNYFNLHAAKSNIDSTTFHCTTTIGNCPWNSKNKLFYINITAPKINLDNIPPSNLVFLIDISGSMDKPNRLPLLQAAFNLLVQNLRPVDKISIVTYGGGVHVALAPTTGDNKPKIKDIIDSLYADGDTPGEGAIKTAYAIAKSNFIENGNNRIILATDGDFNVGQTSERDLEDLISFYKQSNIYLTCLGVGMGNYKDSKLEILAKKGNGNFAYLDNIQEAEKVLITEFTKTLFSVANDAYLNVNFNPEVVNQYRLIGFDNKKEAVNDSTSELEGGEVGSGHNTVAIFEIEITKEYIDTIQPLAQLHLQYKQHITNNPVNITWNAISTQIANTENNNYLRFANAVVMFGELLKQSKFVKDYTFEDVITIAQNNADITDRSQMEFITLVQKAAYIYNPTQKKRRKEKH